MHSLWCMLILDWITAIILKKLHVAQVSANITWRDFGSIVPNICFSMCVFTDGVSNLCFKQVVSLDWQNGSSCQAWFSGYSRWWAQLLPGCQAKGWLTFVKKTLLYILAYKSQNLRPNLDQKVGRTAYMRVMTRQAIRGLASLPPLWRPTGQLYGAVASTHTQLIALRHLPSPPQSIDVGQSLWRGESHSPSPLSANTPNGCCWIWTVTADTADHQVQLVIRAVRDLRLYRT